MRRHYDCGDPGRLPGTCRVTGSTGPGFAVAPSIYGRNGSGTSVTH